MDRNSLRAPATKLSPRYRPRFSEPSEPASTAVASLPVLDEDVAARPVDPRLWDPMRRFWAGSSADPANAEVNASARKLYLGHLAPQSEDVAGPPFQRIVAVTRASGPLIGWCGIGRRHLCETAVPLAAGAYIFAVATDHAYRGRLLRFDGEAIRAGSAVMRAALRQIAEDWDGDMPYVWARVKPENLASHRLFDRHGFMAFPWPGMETIRVRPAGLPPG
jgi:ribosomal protein S18 acetylase RimI-like enzyme